jgi:catechol 2,3-dioxygenase-like lactoylglutathione lyase family enzyme
MLKDAPVGPTIPAKDIERAKAFYRDTLELPILEERPDGITFTCGSGTAVFLYPTEFAGTAKNTLAGFRVADVEQEVKELKAKGVTFEEYDSGPIKTTDSIATFGDIKGAWFRDSEGNILAVSDG